MKRNSLSFVLSAISFVVEDLFSKNFFIRFSLSKYSRSLPAFSRVVITNFHRVTFWFPSFILFFTTFFFVSHPVNWENSHFIACNIFNFASEQHRRRKHGWIFSPCRGFSSKTSKGNFFVEQWKIFYAFTFFWCWREVKKNWEKRKSRKNVERGAAVIGTGFNVYVSSKAFVEATCGKIERSCPTTQHCSPQHYLLVFSSQTLLFFFGAYFFFEKKKTDKFFCDWIAQAENFLPLIVIFLVFLEKHCEKKKHGGANNNS